jgi:CheY-like chemotaxis protein
MAQLEPQLVALRDDDPRVREGAAESLRAISSRLMEEPRAVEALIARLNDVDRGVRRAAARTLGHLKMPQVDDVLARDYPVWHMVYIEDDEMIVDMTKRLLLSSADLKFVVHSAHRGPEGLTLIHQVKPDIVLLDVEVPEMGGGEIYQRMKNTQALRYIPVIVFTADESPSLLSRFAEVEAFLVKPLDIRELLETIKGVLRGRAWV